MTVELSSSLIAPIVALVDDDRNILASVSLALKSEGYDVKVFNDGESALNGLNGDCVDLVLLDIKMPRLDGFEVLRRLRLVSSVPVIFLTSKDKEADELEGLDLGADGYIRKPFSQTILLAHVRALLRRRENDTLISDNQVIVRGKLTIDQTRHLCSWIGQPVSLTVTEFLVLVALVTRPGHVKSRNQLMDAAYNDDHYVDDRTIDSHIKRLRKKFKAIDSEFNSIETLYGAGYRYTNS